MKARLYLSLCVFAAALTHTFSAQGGITVTNAAEGEEHTVFVDSEGTLWGLGENAQGQLGIGDGDGSSYYVYNPQQTTNVNVTSVAAGDYYTVFVKSDGSLWGMGLNTSGQITGGFVGSQPYIPQKIVPGEVSAVAARGAHTLFIKTDGSLWGMGDDQSGDLGDGTNVSHPAPEQIVESDVVAVAAGANHSMFIKSDGSLWVMGANDVGQLGLGTNVTASWTPVMIVSSNVTAIAAGEQFSMFIKSDGSLWGMGWDLVGELGDGGNPSNAVYFPEQIVSGSVTAVATGDFHTLFLTEGGALWAMGSDQEGQLGDGNDIFTRYNRFLPESITNNVNAIFAGGATSLFINFDAGLWGMGYNGAGQLGPGARQRADVPLPSPIMPEFPFTASPTNGQVPLFVNFTSPNTDNYGNNIVSWEWNFGDGTGTNTQNATHLYTSPGNYTVSLLAKDSSGNYVAGNGPDSISVEPTNLTYSVSPTNGFVTFTANFSAAATDADGNSITYWIWNFGDGTTSGLQNPSHLYTSPGNYQITLTATNDLGDSLTGTGPTNITALAPSFVNYSASPTTGQPPLLVQFSSPSVDSGGHAITSWNWDFGDGVGSSSSQNPSYTYSSFGDFQPTLVVRNSLGELINATGPAIDVAFPFFFTACPTNGTFPATVEFQGPSEDNEGKPIVSWNWDFGDGSGTSTLQNPGYVYFYPSMFTPTLSVQNNSGDTLNVPGPTINLTEGVLNSGLVVNGGFETGDFTGWTLTNYVNSSASTYVDSYEVLDGNYGADFEEYGSLDYLSQTVATTPNLAYVLSFWLNSPDGLTPNEFLASWNGATLFDQTNMPAFGWTNIQYVVHSTTGSAVLLFGGRDDQSDLGLDDVSVTPAAPGIPSVSLSGPNLVLTGSNGISGQTYCVVASSSLVPPLSQWTPILTNVLCMNGPFTITITNAIQPAVRQQFYSLVLK